ncbi:Wzz/FepE/Etk N-terminal domain-containing protein [Dysgonomonas sp. Marseille-Q5470]|uniref:Wzz/FepE/Etk N-terminal domain-containing protein n=1 Tax=Dysgonomonas sp. Marseille-Q5470 TaxID=3039494 RepID=UPI0024BBF36A|nr:Wzz/FepE/Etk N-terminal domain-containing protein [Dysgonomonas sp. Marseille-Q5470]
MKEEIQDNISEEKEIDLLALGKKIWQGKRFILKCSLIGLTIGIIISFSIPKEYTTTVILTPESQSSNTGTMSSLAALAGINLNTNLGEDILASPNLYPTIFNSTSFLKGLFDIPLKSNDNNINTTLYNYIKDYERSPWWEYILSAPFYLKETVIPSNPESEIKDKSPRALSKQETDVIKSLRKKLIVDSDKKTSIVTIEVSMQNPEVSAFIADTLTSYLQSYIIKYRTQKAREDLSYAEKLNQEAKENYYKAQANLASFIDNNMNVVSAKYRTTQEKLQNEATLTYSIYNQTAQQVQLAKIKVQNTTPVFTVIQTAIEPLHPSKPSKKTIILGFIFLSLVSASIWILKKDIWKIIAS